MDEIKMLEMEITLMLDTIKRLKIKQEQGFPSVFGGSTSNSHVLGELKHRAVALKQRLTGLKKLTVYNIVKAKIK